MIFSRAKLAILKGQPISDLGRNQRAYTQSHHHPICPELNLHLGTAKITKAKAEEYESGHSSG